MTKPDPVEETWLFAGTRIGRSGKRIHAWLPLPNDDLDNELYFGPTGRPAVGSEYTVKVTRHQEGETARITLHGNPVYQRQHDDEELRARVEARHRAAETTLRRDQMERSDKRASALEETLEPLVKISSELRATDRDAFLAYVIRKITRPWHGSR
ncbi:hypothetical protein [Actinophytocola sediminis]